MLNPEQRKWLRTGLSDKVSKAHRGSLTNKTYAEIAKAINQKFGLNTNVPTIRYYVRRLKKEARPQGRIANQSDLYKQIGVIGHTLLALTGCSTRCVYNLIKQVTFSRYPPVSLVSFYAQLKTIKPIPKKVIDTPPRELLLRCKLRLHQVFFTNPSDELSCLLLLGFETETGFCNAQWFEAGLSGEEPNATPEFMDNLAKSSGGKVSNEILVEFCQDCQARLHLPLVRFQLPSGYCANDFEQLLQFTGQSPTIDVSKLPSSVVPIPTIRFKNQLKRFQRRIRLLINRNNREVASERTQDVWSAIKAQLSNASRPKSHLFPGDKRCKPRIEDDLIKFYKDHSQYPGSIASLSKQVTTL